MFTLAFVLMTIWSIDILKEKMQKLPKVLWYFVSWIIIIIMCIAAIYLSLDYEHHAILIGYFFWLRLHVYTALVTFRLWSDTYI